MTSCGVFITGSERWEHEVSVGAVVVDGGGWWVTAGWSADGHAR